MANTQADINRVCKYRGVPMVKKGTSCEVDGEQGLIWGGNHSANFNVKFGERRIRSCHPYWKMKIFNASGGVLYEHKDSP